MIEGRKKIITYPIASGNMYYAVVGERSIYLKSDPGAGIILYGEIDATGDISEINLAEVFLEYAMSCDWSKSFSGAPLQFEHFVNQIGEALLSQIERGEISDHKINRVYRLLVCICKSMEAEVDIRKSDDGILIEFDHCPIMITAEKKGMMIESSHAHKILRSLCRNLVHVIDPMMIVEFQQQPDRKHIIRISAEEKEKAGDINIPSLLVWRNLVHYPTG